MSRTVLSAATERLADSEREAWHRRDRALLHLSQRDPRASLVEGQRWLAEVAPGSEAEAWARRAYSHPLRAVGNYTEALTCAEEAEHLFDALEQPVEVARTAAGHVWTLRYLGRYEEAVALARRARRFFRSRGETLEAARLTNNLGTLYRPMGRLEAARRCYAEAARDFGRCGDAPEEATAISNLGNVLAELGRYGEAEWVQRRAIRLYERLNRPAQLARAWLNLGALLKRRGDYGRALVVLQQSRELAGRIGAANGEPFADIELAQTYLALNLQQEAGTAIERAREAFERLAMPQDVARALLWSAALARRRGEPEEAAARLAEATALFRRHGNQLWEAVATVLAADLSGASDTAVMEIAAAERRLLRLGSRDRALEARLVRADLLQRLGQDQQALAHCRTAMRGIARLGNTKLAYRASAALGRLLERDRPGRALAHYRAAIEHLETLRRQARADDLKLALVADKLDVYERAAYLLLDRRTDQRRHLVEALAVVERGKSTGLLEELLARAERGGKATSAAARRLRDLRARLGEAYARRDAGGPPNREDECALPELEQAVATATRELQLALRDEPAVAPFDLARLQATLPAETVLLEYYSLGSELVCFVVDSTARGGGLRLRRGLGTTDDAGRLAERLRFQVGKGAYGAEYLEANLDRLRAAFDRVLADLWQQLLAPLAADLEAAQQVVIVAHGPLHGLPLHAALDGETYLAERLRVSYAPSARVFSACTERQPGPSTRPLFVGPHDDLLPWVAQEVAALAELYPGSDALVGRRATRANLRRRAGQFDLLHLAAHGQFRSDNPSFSALRLTDGWLNVGDLAELSRDATLVTLSACDSGLNRLEAGEELVGLTRAVLGAGATSLLASLWSVHDRATCRFMAEFYGGLSTGLGKAASLQGAMRAVRRELDHPFFWAPFALSGAV